MVDYVRSVLTGTIASSGTKTGSIAIGPNTVMAVQTPASMTGTELTFEISNDDTTFVPLRDSAGAAIAVTVDTTAAAYALNANDFAGFNYIKVVSGSAEGADRDIVLHTEKL